jgi:DNA-binding transcriptional regulator of glucitol operon
MHALVLFVVAAFLTLGWWQAIRAGDGNARSIGYALEWPTFAIIVIFLWVRAMRTELRMPEGSTDSPASYAAQLMPPRHQVSTDEDDDPELAAYNRYLAELNDKDLQSPR